jgi:hypothetical protein
MVVGMLFLLTFVSIPTLSIYDSMHAPNYILGNGSETEILIAIVLEIIVDREGIGTSVGY